MNINTSIYKGKKIHFKNYFLLKLGDVGEGVSVKHENKLVLEGNGNPLQHSCLKNPLDRGAWWATVNGVAKSWTRLKQLITAQHSTLLLIVRKNRYCL